ncbi:hypothetical protein BJAS_P2988 [Bathymodiolus japonicus methanotrophic gill symbiont]|nr:hypothetical protein BJAS_P2988 [Bathymodiolus japonicus methanotrophic gill symbiont]
MRGNSLHSKQITPVGYFHPLYAASLGEFGTSLELKESGGWLLCRSITDSSRVDAMGCYPMFSCNDWTQLPADLDTISSDLVSVTLVSDPFGNYDKGLLLSCFDRVVPLKEHYVVDLDLPLESYASATDILNLHVKHKARWI